MHPSYKGWLPKSPDLRGIRGQALASRRAVYLHARRRHDGCLAALERSTPILSVAVGFWARDCGDRLIWHRALCEQGGVSRDATSLVAYHLGAPAQRHQSAHVCEQGGASTLLSTMRSVVLSTMWCVVLSTMLRVVLSTMRVVVLGAMRGAMRSVMCRRTALEARVRGDHLPPGRVVGGR